MHLFRTITLIFALLAQAMPVTLMAAQSEKDEVCEMKCCAWQKQATAESCGCIESPVTKDLPDPANTPPISSRNLVPQPQWVALIQTLTLPDTEVASSIPSRAWLQHEAQALTQPHVRLSVLFCSFLT